MYSIITIDGVDGVGKTTVSSYIKIFLENRGFEVEVISPPFYETPMGKIVKDYLQTGFGDIRDRLVASQLYAMDRNLWMKENFHKFLSKENSKFFDIQSKKVFLYNRNWISNLFYQTTIGYQSDEDQEKMDFPRTTVGLSCMRMTELHEIFTSEKGYPDIPEDRLIALKALYLYDRAADANRMIRNLYEMEIAPWYGIQDLNLKWVDFVTAAKHVVNLVLTPDAEAYQILYSNLMKRYQGDTSKMDRNEKSQSYMVSVIENIHWLKMYWELVTGENQIGIHQLEIDLSSIPNFSRSYSNIIPLNERIRRAFQYDIIHTNQSNDTSQLPISQVVDLVEGKIKEGMKL